MDNPGLQSPLQGTRPVQDWLIVLAVALAAELGRLTPAWHALAKEVVV